MRHGGPPSRAPWVNGTILIRLYISEDTTLILYQCVGMVGTIGVVMTICNRWHEGIYGKSLLRIYIEYHVPLTSQSLVIT